VSLNLVAGAATIVLTAAVARRLVGDRVAVVAAVVVAVWPNLVVHSAVALSETVFLPLVLGIVVVAIDGLRAPRGIDGPRVIALGPLVAAAVYVRPVAAPMVGVLLVAWLVHGLGWRRAVGATAVVTVVAVALLAPWLARNHAVVGAYTLSSNTGDNLCMSRQPGATGGFWPTIGCGGDLADAPSRGAYERARDDAGRHQAIDFLRHEPLTELGLWPQRLWHAVENDFDGVQAVESYGDGRFLPDGMRRALQLISDAWFAVIVVLASVALPRAWRANRTITVLVAGSIVATVVLPVVAFFGDPRFHVPAIPFLAVLAALVISDRRRART
jgi:4-amino-4-deoxy-L-arabinose transferase-like glycosyltransferase